MSATTPPPLSSYTIAQARRWYDNETTRLDEAGAAYDAVPGRPSEDVVDEYETASVQKLMAAETLLAAINSVVIEKRAYSYRTVYGAFCRRCQRGVSSDTGNVEWVTKATAKKNAQIHLDRHRAYDMAERTPQYRTPVDIISQRT